MNVPFADLNAQYHTLKAPLDKALVKVIEECAFIRGPYVEAFEEEWRAATGAGYCVSVADGTDAIYIALKQLGIAAGDEVIVPANTWISSSETITQAGGKPVFVDVEDRYYNLDADKFEAAITPATKGIVLVHLLGQPADAARVREICDTHGLFLIEDCAQAHLAKLDGKMVGSFGHAATYSFYPGKNLGAYGDAGAITTNDAALAAKMRSYARHGASPAGKHSHIMEGINSRLDGLQAAVLSVKLPHLTSWTESRRENAARYSAGLSGITQVICPEVREGGEHVFHVYEIRCERRDALQEFLKERGIQSARHYPTPLPFLECYSYLGHSEEDFPVAACHAKEILSLPMFPELSEEQSDHVCAAIKEFYAG